MAIPVVYNENWSLCVFIKVLSVILVEGRESTL